ncbi:TonB-dependent receptor [Chitinophagaceae bacterium LB-8]|uniref:TonB-dependent receptor n=1 Tax=Paraflavisolibacter caeni TaxID=2982496 RepID=A0A9X3B6G1_9BACT|nr:TonB-dependent receptor [Paraflavisolibacter caeni]MCU7547985.1 TonB-dependent receptor [Paraflavisolibacter caeni]
MKMKISYLLLLLFAFVTTWAQNVTVSGDVMKQNGEALAGATVKVKGTTTATTTDEKGHYSIKVPDLNVTLVFSYVGNATQEVAVNGKANVTVVLKEQASSMDEVVVIGYGTTKRKNLTGTVSSMNAAQLEKVPVSSAAEAITGRMPGVSVTTTDGAPGAEIVIRVRGGGSVTQDNSPLYIVDGFQVSSMNDISPNDIASIDILKDAATAAIYGAKGANGVVIITTKSAKGGKTSISYNGFTQLRTLPKKLDVLSPYEFTLAQYEYAKVRSQSDLDNFTKYFGVYEDLELYKSQKGTDWQDKLFGKPVVSQQHNLSVTGGTDKTKLSFSLANNKDQGLMPGSAYQRTYLNFKLNHAVSDALKLDLGARFSNTVVDGAGTSGSSSVRIGDGITTRPVNGLADAIKMDEIAAGSGDDEYEQFLKSIINPIDLAAQDYRRRNDKVLNMNAAASWSIIKNLSYRSEFGYDLSFGQNKRYYGPLTGESKNVGGNLPLGEITNSNGTKYRWANTLTYLFNLGSDHDFNVMVGQEVLGGEGFSEFNRAKYFAVNLTPEVLFANMALGTQDRHSTSVYEGENMFSVFGRINYTYKDKYLLTLTNRGDASSKFAPGNRLGLFPAAALAWRASKENFLQDVEFINDLKFRVSYGTAGNNRIPNNAWRQIWTPSDNRTYGWGDISNTYWTPASSTLPNPNIKWETTITRNTGADFSLFKNRISGSLDLYWNTTKDLLVQQTIPDYTGYSSQLTNIGQTSNRGIELALNGILVNKKDLQITASFNAGMNRSRIDQLDGVNQKWYQSGWAGTDLKSSDDYMLEVGKSVGLIYGFVTDGMYTSDDFTSYNAATKTYVLNDKVANVGSLMGGLSVRPGLLKLKDLNGDGLITADKDRTVIGNALPKAQGGFNLSGTYKGFDAGLFFNWVYGNDIYNTGKISFNMLYRTTYGNMLNTMNYNDRYKYIDANGNLVTDLAELAELNKNAKIWTPFSMGTASPVVHSWAIEDGSFIRLNNVTFGYSLPKSVISKVRLSKLRAYATVYNALLFTKYSGFDPEVSATRSSSYSQLTPGVDYSAYPKSRTYTFGLNVTF